MDANVLSLTENKFYQPVHSTTIAVLLAAYCTMESLYQGHSMRPLKVIFIVSFCNIHGAATLYRDCISQWLQTTLTGVKHAALSFNMFSPIKQTLCSGGGAAMANGGFKVHVLCVCVLNQAHHPPLPVPDPRKLCCAVVVISSALYCTCCRIRDPAHPASDGRW